MRGIAAGIESLSTLIQEEWNKLSEEAKAPYEAEAATGVRWNDPAFQIDWPLADPIVNDRDQSFSDYVS